jgi:hypothetical protein
MNKNLVSPARQLSQKSGDLKQQRMAREFYGDPESVEVSDIINAAKVRGPMPTLLNVTTGEWNEVNPYQARTMGVPVGPPNPDIINRMWRDGMVQPLPLYGSDILTT